MFVTPPLLSLCIPTKNRADVLEQCLKAIFEAKNYDCDMIEVVISDNASTDCTQDVVKRCIAGKKNVIYNRNKENLGVGGELNFIKVLSLANGSLLKLVNDYTLVTDAAIETLLRLAREYEKEKYPIVFVPSKSVFEEHIVNTMSEMVELTKEHITWIGAHAYWRDSWRNLQDKTKLIDTCFMQTDWLLRLVVESKPIIVEKGPYWGKLQTSTPFGGYNWFKVQLANFIDIHKPYVLDGRISKHSFDIMKRAVYKSRLSEYKNQFFLRPNNKHFENGRNVDVLRLFWKYYKEYWWFYLHFPFYVSKLFLKRWIGYWWLKRKLRKESVS